MSSVLSSELTPSERQAQGGTGGVMLSTISSASLTTASTTGSSFQTTAGVSVAAGHYQQQMAARLAGASHVAPEELVLRSLCTIDYHRVPFMRQLVFLLYNYSKKKGRSSNTELGSFTPRIDSTSLIQLIRIYFSTCVQPHYEPKQLTKDFHQAFPIFFLVDQIMAWFDRLCFPTSLLWGIEHPLQWSDHRVLDTMRANPAILSLLARALKLNRENELRFCIMLIDSTVPELRSHAEAFITQRLPDALRQLTHADERLLMDLDPKVYRDLLELLEPAVAGDPNINFITIPNSLNNNTNSTSIVIGTNPLASGVSYELKKEFTDTLQRIFMQMVGEFPLALKPMVELNENVYSESATIKPARLADERDCTSSLITEPIFTMPNILADVLLENGLDCLSDLQTCRNILRSLPSCTLAPEAVSRAIALLASCHTYVLCESEFRVAQVLDTTGGEMGTTPKLLGDISSDTKSAGGDDDADTNKEKRKSSLDATSARKPLPRVKIMHDELYATGSSDVHSLTKLMKAEVKKELTMEHDEDWMLTAKRPKGEMVDTSANEYQWITGSRKPFECSNTTKKIMLNFIQTVIECAPRLSWHEVVYELDHEGFWVPGRMNFYLLIQGIFCGLRKTPFPVELFYRHWAHSSSQLSFFVQALRSPDLFDFAAYPATFARLDVVTVAGSTPVPQTPGGPNSSTGAAQQLKGVNERLAQRPQLRCWQITDMVETLLFLGDSGFKSEVLELFNEALNVVPDMLVFSLMQLQSNAPMSQLRCELIRACFERCVAYNLNCAPVITAAWQQSPGSMLPGGPGTAAGAGNVPTPGGKDASPAITFRTLFVEAMAEWYLLGECNQTRLMRILDITQDMKLLGDVLNFDIHHFVIDLAVLASRREYLKLEKWIEEKIKEHGKDFFSAVLRLLRRRSPTLLTGDENADNIHLPEQNQLPAEVIAKSLSALQNCRLAGIGLEYSDQLVGLFKNYTAVLKRPFQPGMDQLKPPGGALLLPPSVLEHHLLLINSPIVKIATQPLSHIGAPGSPMVMTPTLQQQQQQQQQQQGRPMSGTTAQQVGNKPATPTLLSLQRDSPQASSSNLLHRRASAAMMAPISIDQSQQMMNRQQHGISSPPMMMQPIPLSKPETAGGSASAAEASPISDEARACMPEAQRSYSDAVEQSVLSVIEQMFRQVSTVDDALETMKRWQQAPADSVEREHFDCALKTMFFELDFVASFPQHALECTAKFIGGLVQREMLSTPALTLVLKTLVRFAELPPVAVSSPPIQDADGGREQSPRDAASGDVTFTYAPGFRFAVICMLQFLNKMQYMPVKFCERLLDSRNAARLPTDLRNELKKAAPHAGAKLSIMNQHENTPKTDNEEQIRKVLLASDAAVKEVGSNSKTPIGEPQSDSSAAVASDKAAKVSNNNSNAAGRAAAQKPTAPPSDIQNKLSFLCNNLSEQTLADMAKKFRELFVDEEAVGRQYLPWVAEYLAVKRIASEANHHPLYAGLLEHCNSSELYDLIIDETVRQCKKILRTPDKALHKVEDRNLLRNLGHWLGLVTLARNRPIRARDIDVKALLVEAFHKGQNELHFVLPFVSRILEAVKESKIFTGKNPWTVTILRLLSTIYKCDMKLNLKFEVEVLAKKINIDIQSYEASPFLDSRAYLEQVIKVAPQLSGPGAGSSGLATPTMLKEAGGEAALAASGGSSGSGGKLSDAGGKISGIGGIISPTPGGAFTHAGGVNASGSSGPGTGRTTPLTAASGVLSSAGVKLPPRSRTPDPISSAAASGSNNSSASASGRASATAAAAAAGAVPGITPTSGMPHSLSSTGLSTAASTGASTMSLQQHLLREHQQQQHAQQAQQQLVVHKPQLIYAYSDVDHHGARWLVHNVTIGASISQYCQRSEIRKCLATGLDQFCAENVDAITDRIVGVAMPAAEAIVKKDFALDGDEHRLRNAAQLVARYFAAGAAYATVKEQTCSSLIVCVNRQLTAFVNSRGAPTKNDSDVVVKISESFVKDNMPVVMAYVQKSAADKTCRILIEDRLVQECQQRIQSRAAGTEYVDQTEARIQAERIPRALRMRPGERPSARQSEVYDIFQHRVPGFRGEDDPPPPRAAAPGEEAQVTNQILDSVINRIDVALRVMTSMTANSMDSVLSIASAATAEVDATATPGVRSAAATAPPTSSSSASLASQVSGTSTVTPATATSSTTVQDRHVKIVDDLREAVRDVRFQHPERLSRLIELSVVGLFEGMALFANAAAMHASATSANNTASDNLASIDAANAASGVVSSTSSSLKTAPPAVDPQFIERFRHGVLAPLAHFQLPTAFNQPWLAGQVTKAVLAVLERRYIYSLDGLDTLFKEKMIISSQLDAYFCRSVLSSANKADLGDENSPVRSVTTSVSDESDLLMLNGIAGGISSTTTRNARYQTQLVKFLLRFMHRFFIKESLQSYVQESEFYNTIIAVQRWAANQTEVPADLHQIMDQIKLNIYPGFDEAAIMASSSTTSPLSLFMSPNVFVTPPEASVTIAVHAGILLVKDVQDPPNFKERVENVVGEWVKICNNGSVREALGLIDRALPTDWAKDSFRRLYQNLTNTNPLKTLLTSAFCRNEEYASRFVRVGTEALIEMAYRVSNETPNLAIYQSAARLKVFFPADCFAWLLAFIVRFYPQEMQTFSYKVFGILGGKMCSDIEFRESPLTMHVYARIISSYYKVMTSPFLEFEKRHVALTVAYTNVLHAMRPAKAPAFAFSWMSLICERSFIDRMLVKRNGSFDSRSCDAYCNLLLDLLNFLYPFARNITLSRGAIMLFRVTLRLLVLMHRDFSDFCSYYYPILSDAMPTSAVQLRNVLLSAGPDDVPCLVEHYSDYMKHITAPMLREVPKFKDKFDVYLQPETFKRNLDSYLISRTPVAFLSDLASHLLATIGGAAVGAGQQSSAHGGGDSYGNKNQAAGGQQNDDVVGVNSTSASSALAPLHGHRYNVPKLNALVLYVGHQAVLHFASTSGGGNASAAGSAAAGTVGTSPGAAQASASAQAAAINPMTPSSVAHTSHMDIIQSLAMTLDSEGRYLLIHSLANNLRYPNAHTHYFQCVILHLFRDAHNEHLQEIIARVLVERVISHPPHPWGLVATCGEVFCNAEYGFWQHDFAYCHPEITRMFETITRQYGHQRPAPPARFSLVFYQQQQLMKEQQKERDAQQAAAAAALAAAGGSKSPSSASADGKSASPASGGADASAVPPPPPPPPPPLPANK